MTRWASRRMIPCLALLLTALLGCRGAAPTPDAIDSAALPSDAASAASRAVSPPDLLPAIPLPESWHRVDDPDFGDEVGGVYSMASVASGPAGYVSVGPGPTGSNAWVSQDGSSWDRVASDDAFGRGIAERVVAIDGGFLAIGRSETAAAVSWTSADGRTWSGPAKLPGLDRGLINDIALGPVGVVAIGYSLDDKTTLRFFVSPDGHSWRVIDAAPKLGVHTDIAVGGSAAGYLVIASSDASRTSSPTAWRSSDGEDWTERPMGVGTGLAVDIAVGSAGMLASLSGSGRSSWLIARSGDGASWQVAPAPGSVARIFAVPGGYLATSENDQYSDLWQSSDGVAWESIDGFRSFDRSRLHDVTVRGGTIIAVGETETATDLVTASVWIGATVPPAAPSPTTGAACPEDPIEVGALVRLSATDRLVCFGDRPIHLLAYVQSRDGSCGGPDIQPFWLGSCSELVFLHGVPGASVGLPARLHPSTGLQAFTLPKSRWVRVIGHHDDPAAAACRETARPGAVAEPIEVSVLECRRQLVITDLREAVAP